MTEPEPVPTPENIAAEWNHKGYDFVLEDSPENEASPDKVVQQVLYKDRRKGTHSQRLVYEQERGKPNRWRNPKPETG